MSFILGMDTGGTYTDAVIIDAKDRKVLCKAKALTTKDNLTTGIKNCLDQLEFDRLEEITLISLSTTLATNAIVEGRGGRVALLYMGAELEEDIPAAKSIRIRGAFDIMGRQKEALEEEEIRRVLKSLKGKVDAVAISGYASVRNPKHEQEAAKIAEDVLGIPVICAHHLSTALGFYHRTVTAVLNGRLISIIDDLLVSTRKVLKEKGISGSIMVVKGDGTLMTEKTGRSKTGGDHSLGTCGQRDRRSGSDGTEGWDRSRYGRDDHGHRGSFRRIGEAPQRGRQHRRMAYPCTGSGDLNLWHRW